MTMNVANHVDAAAGRENGFGLLEICDVSFPLEVSAVRDVLSLQQLAPQSKHYQTTKPVTPKAGRAELTFPENSSL